MNGNIQSSMQQAPQDSRQRFRRFAVILLWIFVGGFIAVLLVMRSYSGVPLLFGVLFAILLYRLTRKLIAGRRREVRMTAWILMVLSAYAIYTLLWYGWGMVRVELLRWQLEQPERAFQKLLAKDTYGGKTPQETYEMYLDALKKGDIDLAVKYYVPGNDQREEKEFLEKLKSLGSLEKWVAAHGEWDTCKEIKAEDWRGGLRKSYECEFNVVEPIDMGYSGYQNRDHLVLTPGRGMSLERFVFIESSGLWKLYINY